MDIEGKNFSESYMRDIERLFTKNLRLLKKSFGQHSVEYSPRFIKNKIKTFFIEDGDKIIVPIVFSSLLSHNFDNKDKGFYTDIFIPEMDKSCLNTTFNTMGDQVLRDLSYPTVGYYTGFNVFKTISDQDRKEFYYTAPGMVLDESYNIILCMCFEVDKDTGDVNKIVALLNNRVFTNDTKLYRNIRNRYLICLLQRDFNVRYYNIIKDDDEFIHDIPVEVIIKDFKLNVKNNVVPMGILENLSDNMNKLVSERFSKYI